MTNDFSKLSHKTHWLPITALSTVWTEAQRAIDPAWVKRIADNLDPDMFDDLIVTKPNGEGIYHIVDGQHRKAAAQTLFGDNQTLPCRIVDAEDPARAAQIFDACNTQRKKPGALDLFRVRVTGECQVEVAVDKIIKRLGYKVSPGLADGNLAAVTAAVNVYKQHGGENLTLTLQVIQAIWGKDKASVASPIIRGVSAFLAKFGHKANLTRLVDKMSKSYTPGRIIGAAKAAKDSMRLPSHEAMSVVIINAYNHGAKKGTLEYTVSKPKRT